MLHSLPLVEWTHGEWTIKGSTIAGIGTCYLIPGLNVAFDVAQGLPQFIGVSRLFITHGHMDHASGIPYLISQRGLAHLSAPEFYMPSHMVAPMKQIMATWEQMEGHQYQFHFNSVKPGEAIPLRADLVVRPFEAHHRIPALGYTLLRRKKRLKAEFAELKGKEIRELRKSGTEVEENWEEPEVSFSGDSRIEFFDNNELVRRSRILFMEVTYIDDRKSVENARDWGHVHLDELLPRLDQFEGEKIVITHLSSRYSVNECIKILDQRVPSHLRSKVDVFPQS
ncbi:MAG: MBL fold metallo-hydrolase [Bdellovibrionaceae bacterium]|nr:MBL fold metallo-hydrolase [Bdellovibrionales bacterium]MCB9082749.1 MBL fold metallo-hydrolase [Pseudobdellovibrionaceae bacterium]